MDCISIMRGNKFIEFQCDVMSSMCVCIYIYIYIYKQISLFWLEKPGCYNIRVRSQPLPLWNPQRQGIPPLALAHDQDTSSWTLRLGFWDMKTCQDWGKLNQSEKQEGLPRQARSEEKAGSDFDFPKEGEMIVCWFCPWKGAKKDGRKDDENPS